MNIVCSHCYSLNRIPDERIRDRPICGKCKTLLLPPHPVELSEEAFEKIVARSDVPILVDFWAAWCGPCRMMAPEFAKAAERLSPRMVLAKLNTEEAPSAATQFQITGIPTMILFRGGREVARYSGMLTSPQIVQWASSNCS